MRYFTHLWLLAAIVAVGAACDDTAREVKREINEIAQPAASDVERTAGDGAAELESEKDKVGISSDDIKQDLKDAGKKLKREAEEAADGLKDAVDEADKDVARKIRE
jgi:hypothetical protein